MVRTLLIISLIFLFSCHSSSVDYAQIKPDSTEFKHMFSDYSEHHELTDNDLSESEEILIKALEDYKREKSTPLTAEAIKNDRKQYISYINDKGQKIIWINGLCRILETPIEVGPDEFELRPWDWKNEIIQVDDGGPCYWRATVNMDTEKVALMINGF